MKNLRKTKFCLGLQIKHFPNGVLVHQSTYIKKILKRFYMDKVHHLTSPIVVWSLDVKNDLFRPCEKYEELLGLEVPYISVVGALIYLSNSTCLNIVFSINLLARYNFTPTRRHWNDIKHILPYLCGITNVGLFYSRKSSNNCLDIQMQDTFQIHIKVGHKHGICLIAIVLLFHRDLSNKQW